jgi:hypothetical protein
MSARWEGIRVRTVGNKRAGTVLLGPVRRYGKDWPGFNAEGQWVVPVRMDDNAMPELFQASLLEPYTDPEPREDEALRDLAKATAREIRDLELKMGPLRHLADELERRAAS